MSAAQKQQLAGVLLSDLLGAIVVGSTSIVKGIGATNVGGETSAHVVSVHIRDLDLVRSASIAVAATAAAVQSERRLHAVRKLRCSVASTDIDKRRKGRVIAAAGAGHGVVVFLLE